MAQSKRSKMHQTWVHPSMAIVPHVSLACVGCEAGSEMPWAQYTVSRNSAGHVLQRLPVGPFCQDCAETILEAARPGKADLQAAASDKTLGWESQAGSVSIDEVAMMVGRCSVV